MRFDRSIKTGGDGLWSSSVKSVKTTELELDATKDADGKMWGELQIEFDTSSWNINEDGLIYTDKTFMNELRAELNFLGLIGDDVTYSEQGMQGNDYVSCDVGTEFIEQWIKKGLELEFYQLDY